MSELKCLGCYLPLTGEESSENYHKRCSKKLFGTDNPPKVDFGIDQLVEMAKKSIAQHIGVTGVQQKVSVDLEKYKEDPSHRLMIVGLWGNYILKPPTEQFPQMSVVEDATMHMAAVAGIPTALHGLLRLTSGEMAYITKRFDRDKRNKKVAMEDFCQLSELLTIDKYNTSTEKAGKIILKYSSNPGLDAITFFDLNVFSFLTGNADMHLKNFSLIRNDDEQIVFSPAYDLLSTALLLPEDKEEVALTINGKKARLKKIDFITFGKTIKINEKSMENSIQRILKAIPQMKTVIANSFVSDTFKKSYVHLLDSRSKIFL